MRICFVNDIDFLGGGEIWVLRACQHLRSIGHSVSVVCPHGSELEIACGMKGIGCFTAADARSVKQPFQRALYHFLQREQIDLLYCTVMGHFCEARVLARLAERVNRERDSGKLAVILKAGLPPLGHLTAEYYGAGSGPAVRRLHTVSDNVRDAFHAWEPSLGNGFVTVAHEGIDLGEFHFVDNKADAKREWGLAGKTVVTCLARLVDGMKGQSVLLRAAANLLRTHPDTAFLIAGEGEDRQLLEELSADLNLDGHVRFLGHTDNVPSLLAATDVLCHPSLHDGLPNSVVEAMAMSVPVVASRLGGIPEIVEHGVTGMLVRPNDVADLTDALGAMLGAEDQRSAMSGRARERIQERFDLHANLGRLTASLEEELEAFRSAPARRKAPAAVAPAESVPVMFLMNVIRTGGEETELGILARHLDKQRFPMRIATLWNSDEAAPVVSTLKAWGIPIDRTCELLSDEDKIKHLVDVIRRDHIGIVVACQNTELAYRVFERLSPDECRLVEHGGVLSDVGTISKDRTARYVGVSRQIACAAALRMEEPSHAVFIASMVDTDLYDGAEYAAARAETARSLAKLLEVCGYPPDASVVTFVGRLDSRKHVEVLIQAARRLEDEAPHALFLIVGGADAYQPDYEKRLLAEASDLIERSRVVFTGAREDVPGLLSASHILVLPSTGEGMAHVISEGGAAGLAVIATDDGAAREQLEDGRCGELIAPGDVEQLARSLRCLIADKERQTMLGERLRHKVRAEYAAEVVVDRWHTLFTGVKQELSDRVRRANGRRPHPRLFHRARRSEFLKAAARPGGSGFESSAIGDMYAQCIVRTRAALDSRLAETPSGRILRDYFERGKMLRAYLVFAASAAVGGADRDVTGAAEAVELLHAASLFHDDIIDEAPERRGFPSLQARLGIGPALVLGDELLLTALGALAEIRERHPVERVLRALEDVIQLGRRCCRGQYEELKAGPWIDDERYFDIVRGKTGAPFEAAAMLGGALGGGTEPQVAGLRSYASQLGIAFQIADDIQDLVGDSEALGKPAGNSLAHERPLLPIIYLVRDATEPVLAELRDLEGRGWPRREVVELLRRHRAIETARLAHQQAVESAVNALELARLPVLTGVQALLGLAGGIRALA